MQYRAYCGIYIDYVNLNHYKTVFSIASDIPSPVANAIVVPNLLAGIVSNTLAQSIQTASSATPITVSKTSNAIIVPTLLAGIVFKTLAPSTQTASSSTFTSVSKTIVSSTQLDVFSTPTTALGYSTLEIPLHTADQVIEPVNKCSRGRPRKLKNNYYWSYSCYK